MLSSARMERLRLQWQLLQMLLALMAIFFLISALSVGGAKLVTVVAHKLGWGRSERIATMTEMKVQLQTASVNVFAQANALGLAEKESSRAAIGSAKAVQLSFGYAATLKDLLATTTIHVGPDSRYFELSSDEGRIEHKQARDPRHCYVEYTPAWSSLTAATIGEDGVVTSGC